MKTSQTLIASALALVLVGCGGGGSNSVTESSSSLGGSLTESTDDVVDTEESSSEEAAETDEVSETEEESSVEDTTVRLASWPTSIDADTDVESDAQTIGFEVRSGSGDGVKDGSPFNDEGDEVTLEFDSSEDLERIHVGVGGASSLFNTGTYTLIEDGDYAEINNTDVTAVFADPVRSDFEYQSYGAWVEQTDGSSSNNRDLYATTFGVVSTAAQIPDSGSAIFTGSAAGIYYNESDPYTLTIKSDMSANVNFAAGTASVELSNSTIEDPFAGTSNAQPDVNLFDEGDFDIAFTLSNAGNQSNTMSGSSVTGGNGVWSNFQARGEFYGPGAEEIGGAFRADTVNGRGGAEAYVGGFGGSR